MYYTTCPSPLGTITLAGHEEGLAGLWLEGQKYHGGSADWVQQDDLPIFQETKCWLERYFAGARPAASELTLAPEGSDFRKAVWKELCRIPYGETVTYGEIGKRMAAAGKQQTTSARAIGGAVGHNPISVIIPCHRVVGASGSLTGYAGGIPRKIQLLTLEGAELSKFSESRT